MCETAQDMFKLLVCTLLLFGLVLAVMVVLAGAEPIILTASWYSVESCLREGTSGIMANGRKLDDTKFTAASWDYPFKTRLRITNCRSNKSVIIEITDRGPSKRLVKKGRVIDLSRAAFAYLVGGEQNLKIGVIPIKIEVLN